MVELAPLTSKEICALAFGCEPQTNFPVFSWNVTFPNTPKPTPRPPQPPSVSKITFNISQIKINNRSDFSFLERAIEFYRLIVYFLFVVAGCTEIKYTPFV